MLNPKIRARRLRAEYERVQALQKRGELFAIEQALGDPPDRFIFGFVCRGIGKVIGGRPVFSERHLVAMILTETFPTTAPKIEWLTPIFHPNIRADGQAVCIGSWYPAKTLDQLVIMLGEMIQYRNYASHDPLNLEASFWAMENKDLFPVDQRPFLKPEGIGAAAQSFDTEPDIQLL